ncbi:hypothetical protein [Microcystis phage vB_MaeS-yong1]|nr:hypothetical protein [Microcystis phage vB_MaeS-yong1]
MRPPSKMLLEISPLLAFPTMCNEDYWPWRARNIMQGYRLAARKSGFKNGEHSPDELLGLRGNGYSRSGVTREHGKRGIRPAQG